MRNWLTKDRFLLYLLHLIRGRLENSKNLLFSFFLFFLQILQEFGSEKNDILSWNLGFSAQQLVLHGHRALTGLEGFSPGPRPKSMGASGGTGGHVVELCAGT